MNIQTIEINPIKGFWVVVDAQKNVLLWTLSGTKLGAMSSIYDDMSAEQKEELWKDLKKGYYVVKVNVNFELC